MVEKPSGPVANVYSLILWLPNVINVETPYQGPTPYLPQEYASVSLEWSKIRKKAGNVSKCIVITEKRTSRLTALASAQRQDLYNIKI